MKERILFAVVIGLGVGQIMIARGQADIGDTMKISAPGSEMPKAPAEVIKNNINGTVEGVGADKQSLQIKQDSGSITLLRVETGTEIRRKGKTVSLSDLKPGDRVSVKIQ